MRSLLRFITLACLLPVASHALAQSRYALVPVTLANSEGPSPEAIERSLLAAQLPLLPNSQAGVALETEHSSDGVAAGPAEVARLDDLIAKWMGELAKSDDRKSREKSRELRKQLEAEPASTKDFLRREPQRAQLVFDACVTAAWQEHQAHKTAEAKEEMQRCIQTFPGLRPSSGPKKMMALVDEALKQLEDEPHGHLDIRSREGCLVRLNGAAIGSAPRSVDVPTGTVRVQVECDDKPGRIHAVSVHPGTTQLVIDPTFDAALRTGQGLRLVLEHATTAELAQLGDALSSLIAARVILLVPTAAGGVRLLATHPAKELGTFAALVDAQAALMAEIRANQPPPAPAKPSASKPFVEAVRVVEPEAAPPGTANHPSVWPTVVAGVGVAVGIAGVAASWVFYAQRLDQRAADLSFELSFDARDRFRVAGHRSVLFGSLGNAVLASSEYVLLPQARGIPSGAWVAAGGGIVLGGVGAVLAITQRECSLPSAACTKFMSDPLFGELLMFHALPLLAAPLNYWLRAVLNPPVRVELGLGGGLQVTGVF